MIQLDTNICIYIINRRSPSAVRELRARTGFEVSVSTITVAELEYGVAKSSAPERNRLALYNFLAPLGLVPFDEAAAARYGEIRAYLERAGTPIGPNDLFIAAHASSRGATLVTNNTAEFSRIPGLRVENWLS